MRRILIGVSVLAVTLISVAATAHAYIAAQGERIYTPDGLLASPTPLVNATSFADQAVSMFAMTMCAIVLGVAMWAMAEREQTRWLKRLFRVGIGSGTMMLIWGFLTLATYGRWYSLDGAASYVWLAFIPLFTLSYCGHPDGRVATGAPSNG